MYDGQRARSFEDYLGTSSSDPSYFLNTYKINYSQFGGM